MFYSWFLDALLCSDSMYDIIYMKFCWEIANNDSLHCSLSHYCILLSVAVNTHTPSYSLHHTVKQNISKICRCFVVLTASSMMQVCNQEPAEIFQFSKAPILWCIKSGIERGGVLIYATKSLYLHIFQLCSHMIKCKYRSAFSAAFLEQKLHMYIF